MRGLIDHIDGFKARNFNQRSTFGAVMDDVCDRWVLGIMYAGGCLNLSYDYPHILIVLGFGITGALTNVIIKLSIYAESQQDIWREKGKIGHPVDVVGLFGSAEFIIYYGTGVFFTALLARPAAAARRLLGGRDHEPRVAAPARAVRVEALPVRRSRAWRRATTRPTPRQGSGRWPPPPRRPPRRAWCRRCNPANAVTASRFLRCRRSCGRSTTATTSGRRCSS